MQETWANKQQLDIGCVDLNATTVSKVDECLQRTVQSNTKWYITVQQSTEIHLIYQSINLTLLQEQLIHKKGKKTII